MAALLQEAAAVQGQRLRGRKRKPRLPARPANAGLTVRKSAAQAISGLPAVMQTQAERRSVEVSSVTAHNRLLCK